MITLSIAGLLTAYVLLAVLLLSLNLYSSFSWPVKAAGILLVFLFYLVSYFSFPPLLGWPTADKLPERFRLLAAHVQEPDKVAGTEGEIYLWITDMSTGKHAKVPRAYKLPFSTELHRKVVEAKTKLNKKLPQLGELIDEGQRVDEVKDNTQGGQASINIEFFDMPDPLFPEK